MNTCEYCKSSFIGREDRPNRFCSHRCHIEFDKIRAKLKLICICKSCGEQFLGFEDRQFCSLACVHQSMRLPEKVCPVCNRSFAPEKSTTIFCSNNCYFKSVQHNNGVLLPDPIEGKHWVSLSKGKFALIDDDDHGRVSKYNWHTVVGKSTCYARSTLTVDGKRKKLSLHRFIMNVDDPDIIVDHHNHNGLDCTKSNLRVASRSQNRMNACKKRGKTEYKGVAVLPNGKFKASIRANNQNYYLGRFDTPEEAALAYDFKARELHGEFARCNFMIVR